MPRKGNKQVIEKGSSWTHQVCDQEASAWLEDAVNFSQAAGFQIFRQMVHHKAGSNHVQAGIGEWQCLDHSHAEIDLEPFVGGFFSSNRDHLGGRVNPIDGALFGASLCQ